MVPTHNEEATLKACVEALLEYLAEVPFDSRITIADNASTDRTAEIGRELAEQYEQVQLIEVPVKGRGIALKTAWSSSDAEVLVYMDVDLSTNLNALLPLVAPLLSGHSDVAIGSRLARTSRVLRGSKREVISRGYNLLLRASLGVGFADAQCGFKALRTEAARWLLPLIEDNGWFFDTELLVLAERAGLRIYEVPVDWVDDPDSRVDLVGTAVADLKGIARLGWNLSRGRIPLLSSQAALAASPQSLAQQVFRFVTVGVLSTIGYAAVFLLLRPSASAGVANAISLVLMTFFNTALNRAWTFRIKGRTRAVTHQAQGFAVLAAALLVTTLSLSLAHDVGVRGSGGELVVLTIANLVVTAGRFIALRHWVFRSDDVRPPTAFAAQPLASGGASRDFAQDQA